MSRRSDHPPSGAAPISNWVIVGLGLIAASTAFGLTRSESIGDGVIVLVVGLLAAGVIRVIGKSAPRSGDVDINAQRQKYWHW